MSTLIHGGGGGVDTSLVTAAAADVLAPKVIVDANGNALTGTITSKAAANYTPGTANQTIAAGQYLSGVQTIYGDADLVAGNIKNGVNIFNVVGTYIAPAAMTVVTLTTSQTWTVPAGVTKLFVYLIGGGAGGMGGGLQMNGSAKGGASGLAVFNIMTVTPGQQISAVIGAGGAGVVGQTSGGAGTPWPVPGNGGGTTSFGSLSAIGGSTPASSIGSNTDYGIQLGSYGQAGGGVGRRGAGGPGGGGATGSDGGGSSWVGSDDDYVNGGVGAHNSLGVDPFDGTTVRCGGGGGGGYYSDAAGGAGGAGGGGAGGLGSSTGTGVAGGPGTLPGAGGGGGGGGKVAGGAGGAGANGLIRIGYFA